eukprot:scaffold280334_cov22-Tisochrysis_lutea.AAC.1
MLMRRGATETSTPSSSPSAARTLPEIPAGRALALALLQHVVFLGVHGDLLRSRASQTPGVRPEGYP